MTNNIDFTALTANPLFYRTYSRYKADGTKESAKEAKDRAINGLKKFKLLTEEEVELITKYFYENKVFVSGRWFWVGGTEWVEKQKNFIGAYNCASVPVTNWDAFRFNFRALLMGCGVGTVVEQDKISQLPEIKYPIIIGGVRELGLDWKEGEAQESSSYYAYKLDDETLGIHYTVGDSKEGWVDVATDLLEFSSYDQEIPNFEYKKVNLYLDLSNVRPAGIPLKGFGGLSNPEKLEEGLKAITEILNETVGTKLNSLQVCKILAWAGVISVSGNIRRCIAHGVKVSASSGMIPIQDIKVGDLVLTSSGEYKPVTQKFIQGKQEIVEIKTLTTSIQCTSNHRIAVFDSFKSYKWKYAGELQKGDRLLSVPHIKGLPTCTTDWAWLVGFFLGDGHADIVKTKARNGGGGSVTFAFSTPRVHGELGQKVIRILTSLGYTPNVNIQDTKATISVYRKEFAEQLGQYKWAWATPVIPDFIWEGTSEIRAAFLAGLSDADGTPSRNVLLNSTKIDFLRNVQKLALSLGIATTLHERQPRFHKKAGKTYDGCHWIHIQGIQSQVMVVGLINQFAIRNTFTLKTVKKNGLSLPAEYAKELAATGWKPSTIQLASTLWKDGKNREGFCRDANYDTLLAEGLVNSHWIPLEVQFVAPIGEAETFDIEVEDDHEFIADGLLVHNSAKLNQGSPDDELFVTSKDNLWVQDSEGNWKIDPKRDMLRLANHSISYHYKPDLETVINAVSKQYYSGEGAIQYTPEFIARGNADLLDTRDKKLAFIGLYCGSKDLAEDYLVHLANNLGYSMTDRELEHRINRYGANPCHEVGGASFLCNLSQVHLNMLDPHDTKQQEEAFKASTLCALPLLSHKFDIEDFRYSREIDPIIGISFTGLFDFFVIKFGVDWLKWWKTGRSREFPKAQYYLDSECLCLELWRDSVRVTTEEYCKKHGIKQPNRYTVVQPSGSVSLLTNASPGWHPPKATRYTRRITYSADSPIVKACRDFGYNVVPSQSCKDEFGNLLNDINDPRVNEVLVEIPIEVSWAKIADEADFNPKDISALAQLDFYMQVQKFYATHTVSATLELSEHEIEPLGHAIYELIQNDEGYISTALLAKFESLETFPRLPFEPISLEQYLSELEGVKQRQISDDFLSLVNKYSTGESSASEQGPSGCDSDKCLMPERK